MKSIYIDVLITVNIFIDFILILCTKKALCIRTSLKKMTLGSVLGGAQSLLALLPALPFAANVAVDVLCAAAIVLVSFGKTNLKGFVKRTAVFFSFSFSLCGVMMFVYSAFKPKGMEVYNDVIYFNISPVLLIILSLACYYILVLIKKLTKGADSPDVCNVEINVGDKSLSFAAKTDTGCNLTEPFSGNYVIVAEKELLEGYVPDERKTRVIPFDSLGGSGIIMGFLPNGVKINGKETGGNIYIGMCENVLKGDVKAIIPPQLTKI